MAKKIEVASDVDAEITAIGKVYGALKGLDEKAQGRVLSYVCGKLNVTIEGVAASLDPDYMHDVQSQPTRPTAPAPEATGVDAEGINSVALRLIKRSGIELKDLHHIFSLGIDEIDLVASKVPGNSKRERFHNVLLLKGIASYLGTGAARVTYEQLKEASLHYNAFDATNAASYLKAFSADVSGSKTSGYTLSPRGLTQGIAIVKSMAENKKT